MPTAHLKHRHGQSVAPDVRVVSCDKQATNTLLTLDCTMIGLTKPMFSSRVVVLLLLMVASTAAGIIAARFLAPPVSTDVEGLLWPNPKPLSAFTLQASDGETLNLDRLQGQWAFMFFGYTYCPDVCPGTLMHMAQVLQSLRESDDAKSVKMVFVSVDPARDTPDRLKDYVTYFDSEFIGATAEDSMLQPFTRDLGVLYVRHDADAEGRYEVDHSVQVLLIDPQGRLVAIFQPPHDVTELAQRFRSIRAIVERES